MENKSTLIERVLRMLVAGLGGYAFTSGFVAMVAVGLTHFGVVPSESATLGGMLSILVYLPIIIWIIATPKLLRDSFLLIFTSIAMVIMAPLLVVVQ